MSKAEPPWMRYKLGDGQDRTYDTTISEKKLKTAYLIFFFGGFYAGFHRFYLKQHRQGFLIFFYYYFSMILLEGFRMNENSTKLLIVVLGIHLIIALYEFRYLRRNTERANAKIQILNQREN